MSEKYIAEFRHGPWHKETRVMQGDRPKIELLVPMMLADHAHLAEEGDMVLNIPAAVYELRGPKGPESPVFIYAYTGYRP